MSKLTTSIDEVKRLESLYPDEDETYGTAYLPRNFEAPMSELLQWPEEKLKNTDFKKSGYNFKDKIQKASNF